MKRSLHKKHSGTLCFSAGAYCLTQALCFFEKIKTEATLKHQSRESWSRERLGRIILLFYCARSHYQIITRMLCISNFFFLYVWKNKILKDIFPPNAERASVVKATGVIN